MQIRTHLPIHFHTNAYTSTHTTHLASYLIISSLHQRLLKVEIHQSTPFIALPSKPNTEDSYRYTYYLIVQCFQTLFNITKCGYIYLSIALLQCASACMISPLTLLVRGQASFSTLSPCLIEIIDSCVCAAC